MVLPNISLNHSSHRLRIGQNVNTVRNSNGDDVIDPVRARTFMYPSDDDIISIQHTPGTDPCDIDEVLRQGVAYGASDVIITADRPVWYRVNGIMFPSDRFQWLSKTDMFQLATGMTLSTLNAKFTQDLELDSSYVIPDGRYEGSRFRVSRTQAQDAIKLVCRYINPHIEDPAALGLPRAAMDWTERPNGLVLVCGPTGSGKSTSVASMIRKIQMEKHDHILTIESPVECIFPPDGLSEVTQREVGTDTLSFSNALVSGMRQAPDVIFVGEMRTNAEIDATIEAADTGHLTMSTLHTKSAEETFLRIISKFGGDDRRDILARLSSNLVGIMSQQLLQRRDGRGRIAVHEVLQVDRGVRRLINDGDVLGLHQRMLDDRTSMDHELLRMVAAGKIKYSEALGHAMNRNDFIELSHGVTISSRIDFNE